MGQMIRMRITVAVRAVLATNKVQNGAMNGTVEMIENRVDILLAGVSVEARERIQRREELSNEETTEMEVKDMAWMKSALAQLIQ